MKMKKSDLRTANASLILTIAVLGVASKFAGVGLFALPALLDARIVLAAQTKQATGQRTVKLGAYRLAGGTVYVGVEAEPPDHPTIQFYDEKTGRRLPADEVRVGFADFPNCGECIHYRERH
jgi:hypothetical protein